MRDIVHSYVRKFREERRERRKFLGVLLCLALAVAGGIMWQFKTTGIAYTNEAQCGIEEHTHSDDCYAWVLTEDAGLEESAAEAETSDVLSVVVEEAAAVESEAAETQDAAAETADVTSQAAESDESADAGSAETAVESETAAEESTDSADAEISEETLPTQVLLTEATEMEDWYLSHGYEKVLICGKEEHTHTIECLSDETADLETAEVWEASLPTLNGVWADDVVAIAESQIGYAESTLNFTLADDGATRKGYTRYGAWYGNAYGDWDAMFAAFCLHYAGVSESDFPVNSGAYAWSVSLKEAGLYQSADNCTPATGDLAFLDKDQDGTVDTVAVITNVNDTTLIVVEGNSNDAVEENTYEISDGVVAGYGVLPEQDADSLTGLTKTYTAEAETEDGSVIVTVTAPYGALPDDAVLSVTLYEEDSDEYAAAAETIGYEPETAEVAATEDGIALASEDDTETETVATFGLAVLDICFVVDGVEVEPSEAVTVSIDASAIIPEEADASTIEVQHLTENEDGEVEAVLVADATEETAGTVTVDAEEATAVAEFEVDGFSTFTLSWYTHSSGDNWNRNNYGATITVNIYTSDDGSNYELASSDDLSYTLATSTSSSLSIKIDDLTADVTGIDDYVYSYATVTYSNVAYGSSSDSVTSVSSSYTTSTSGYGYNQTTTYSYTSTVYTENNTDGEVGPSTSTTTGSTNINYFSINLYYVWADPSVSITSTGSDSEGYILTADPYHFSGTPTYTWSITDGNDIADIAINDDGTATVTWKDGATDNDTVTVQVTATNETDDGTETATNTYTLTYGQVLLTVNVTYNGGTSVSGATVTLTDTDGNVVNTGTTDSNGSVTFTVSNATTYEILASYAISTSATLTGSSEVLVNGATTGTIELVSEQADNSASTSNAKHIDIKYSAAESEETAGATLSDIVSVYVYNNSGTLVYGAYDSNSIVKSSTSSEWQLNFYTYNSYTESFGTTRSHDVTIQSSYTIVITYKVTENGTTKQYTATIDSSSTYADGTYYPADGANAYVLYNYLYGTNYSESSFKNAGIEKIDISGMNMFLVAGILCDGNQNNGYGTYSLMGLDFALSVGSLQKLTANWDFEVQKTFKSGSMLAGDFEFTLSSASANVDAGSEVEVWTVDTILQTQHNSAETQDASGNSTDIISFSQITYSADDGTEDGKTYYYVVKETKGNTAGVTYDGTVYGVKVVVTVTESTSGAVTTQTTGVVATYYELEWSDTYNGYVVSGNPIETWTWSSSANSLISLPFVNSYASTTDFTILKVAADDENTVLSGAVFTLTQSSTDSQLEDVVITYYDSNGTSTTAYTTLTSGNDGKISVTGLKDGTYTLTEVTAPDGYNLLTDSITITVAAGNVTASYGESDIVSTNEGVITLTVENTAGRELPSTGGTGTYLYTLAGLLLILSAVCLMYKNLRRKGDLPY